MSDIEVLLPIDAFLQQLAHLGIKLSLNGDRLRVAAPQGVFSKALQSELKSRKAEIVAFLEMKGGKRKEAIIKPVPRDSHLPLSFAQQRFWVLDRLEHKAGVYLLTSRFEIEGPFDPCALNDAINQVVARHEILSCAFGEAEGIPRLVRGTIMSNLPLIDMTGESPASLQHRIDTLYRQLAQREFQLEKAPLFRFLLFRIGPRSHQLMLHIHHIICDGWSLEIMLREIAAYYSQALGLKAATPPHLPFQYADYASHQRQQAEMGGDDRLLNYWKLQLQGAPTRLDLPMDRPRPSVESFNGRKLLFHLPPSLTTALHQLAHQNEATLFMVLMSGFAVQLYRYSGKCDLVMGVPVANRDHPDLENLVGFFINMLAYRCNLVGNPSFEELLSRIREMALGAANHTGLPFQKLVEALQPDRDLSHHPIFQVMLQLQNMPEPALTLPGAQTRYVESPGTSSKLDLTLSVRKHEQGLSGSFEYNTDLFDATTIRRYISHFEHLLEAVVSNPKLRIGELNLLDAAERYQVLHTWNQTQKSLPPNQTLHGCIEETALRLPHETAVVFGHQSLSYEVLNSRANQLAHHLRALGVGPDTVVGLCLPRSLDMLVAMLGILKAGGGWLPLDPTYPQERLQVILNDADIRVLIVAEDLPENLTFASTETPEQQYNWTPVRLKDCTSQSQANPINRTSSDNLAYVIYTSGSTGKPKGVMLEHQQVLNFFEGMDAHLDGRSGGVWLALTTVSFDISVLELMWPLRWGFKVVIQDTLETYFARDNAARALKPMEMSFLYFSNAKGEQPNKYHLLMESARFADEKGFAAVWTPERHFHDFGGLFPNPSVTGAALATITKNVEIRAGSVVLPLHHPVRVAEEWSVVDNLSNGRVSVSFASGWNRNDFLLADGSYEERRADLYDGLDKVRRLWRGESVSFRDNQGREHAVAIQPRPIQKELPFWLTAAGDPETFREAGRQGAHLLTHLLGQDFDDLARKIAIYRQARSENGLDPKTGRVAVMLHTFVYHRGEAIRPLVREPFRQYLKTSFGLVLKLANELGIDDDPDKLDARALDELLEHAFNRYFETSGLFGTPEQCLAKMERFSDIGVDEIACLVDFGVEEDAVLESLKDLNELREMCLHRHKRTPSIAEQIATHRVTHLQCTPSLAATLLQDAPTHEALASLKAMLVGGEALSTPLASQLAQTVSGSLHNMYGPTETTIWSSTHKVSGGEEKVPLGTPIANTQIYVFDGNSRPLPLNVPGELVIGGLGVSRGYFKRPALTATRFLPDPYSTAPGSRLYRTGDLVRRNSDGRLFFLGRIDHQVKVRGYRIETGDVEAALVSHPDLEEAVVMAVHDKNAQSGYIAAYFVVSAQAIPSSFELRDFLKNKLPDYMVPSSFIHLEAFPTTPNGKIDRGQLPDPGVMGSSAEKAISGPPETPTQQALAQIWCDLLGVDEVSLSDNFFTLGGHSLRAIQCISRIREVFAREVPLALLFERPELGSFAACLEEDTDEAAPQKIPVQPRGGHFPLSYSQRRLWFLDQMEEERVAYITPCQLRLKGPLQIQVLERCLTHIVARHESLRTTFFSDGGEPLQVIGSVDLPELPVVDLSHLSTERAQKELHRAAFEETQRPFDLNHGPLLRGTVLRLAPQDHLFLITIHHIVSDAWSIDVFMRELSEIYGNLLRGEATRLPALPIGYADYAVWQRNHLGGEHLERELSYWRQRLEGAPSLLELPYDRPRGSVQTFNGKTLCFELPASLTTSLGALSQSRGITRFMILQAAFALLLSRYSNFDDISIGSPVAGRNYVEVEPLIGFFVNTIVLRFNLERVRTLDDLLQQSRHIILEAFAHQEVPFEVMVEDLNPERNLSHAPLFQVMFALQTVEISKLQLEGIELEPFEVGRTTSKFDLFLSLVEEGDHFKGTFEYNTDLFEEGTIQAMARHFATIATEFTGPANRSLGQLQILDAGEREYLVTTLNQTNHPQAGGQTLHGMFQARAQAAPQKIALSFAGESLTYETLDRLASALALSLRDHGVVRESRVGILATRTPLMIAAMLAALKSGGVYVALDPNYPEARIAGMLESGQVDILLSDLPEEDLPRSYGGSVLELKKPSTLPSESFSVEVDPSQTAYLVFTSGSTGRPKGVMITHNNGSALLDWAQEVFSDEDLEGVLAATSICFDLSVFEIFFPLSRGGRIILAENALHLPHLPEGNDVTLVNTVPSAMTELVHQGWLPEALRVVNLAGEPLSRDLVERIHRLGNYRVYNLYGPSEDTTYSTYHHIARGEWPTIGRPIHNTRCYLLDSQLLLVPPKVSGQLFLAGAGVTRGYQNNPSLTAARFLPNPFAQEPGERMYATGDLARYGSDGHLRFIGRIDNQIKYHGFRIELGEIESHLNESPLVRECAVLLRQDQAGEPQLLAYLVPETDEQLETPEESGHWERVWDHTYKDTSEHLDTTQNLVGWKSSYTGEPIPTVEMERWLETTLDRIREALAPIEAPRVLEIGCGTGLLLFPLLDHCASYHGTDFSKAVIETLKAHPTLTELAPGRLTLSHREAADLGDVPPHSVDGVILNSVIQYFPGLSYLEDVLQQAINYTASGGFIFIGDVRAHALLEHFQASLLWHHLSADDPATDLAQQVRERVKREEELVVGPEFFAWLAQKIPRISHLDIRLKRGPYCNELTRFRYDVFLHIARQPVDEPTITWLDWEEGMSLTQVRAYLASEQPGALGLRRVPNSRVVREAALLNHLRREADPQDKEQPNAYESLKAIVDNANTNALDPDAFFDLHTNYRANSSWFETHDGSTFDVLLWNRDTPRPHPPFILDPCDDAPYQFANNPRANRLNLGLANKLSADLRTQLPHYMVPSAFVLLDALPLSPNGKINRRALPAYGQISSEVHQYVPPSNPREVALAAIWSDLLNVPKVSVTADFFSLGGHSLLTVRMLAKIEEALGVSLPLSILFKLPTIRALAEMIEMTLQKNVNPEDPFSIHARDLQLPADIRPGTEPAATEYENALLTGATGFLGRFLLGDLLNHTNLRVHCLVRGENQEQGYERLVHTLKEAQLWQAEYGERLVVIPGDLSQPMLGMSGEMFHDLARHIDIVYHAGALVNLIYPYVALQGVNVQGTREALRFACLHKPKPFHHISTIGIFDFSLFRQQGISEDTSLDTFRGPQAGYHQTKWVAERLVLAAGERGLPTRIYRFGTVSGHSQSGVCNTDDFFTRRIKTFLQMGLAPDTNEYLDPVPVDYVARVITEISFKQSTPQTFHILNPKGILMSDMVRFINEAGYPIQSVPYRQWRDALVDHVASFPESPLAPFVSRFETEPSSGNATTVHWDNTRQALLGSGVTCPNLDQAVFNRYVDHLEQEK